MSVTSNCSLFAPELYWRYRYIDTQLLNFDPYDHVTIVAMLTVMMSLNLWNYLACAECADDVETTAGDDGGAAMSHAHANRYLQMEMLTGMLMSHHHCLLAC